MNTVEVSTVGRIRPRTVISPELAAEARKWETPTTEPRVPSPKEPTTDRAPRAVRFDLD